MNQEIVKWIRDVMWSTKVSIIDRFKEGTLRPKYQQKLNEMIEDILEAVPKEEYNGNPLVKELCEGLEKIQTTVSVKLNEKDIERLGKEKVFVERKLDEQERNNCIVAAFQLDIEDILPLMEQLRIKQEETRQTFQKAVDIDYSLFGQPSELILQALDAFHFEITDKQVVTAGKAIPEKQPDIEKEEQTVLKDEPERVSKEPKKEYIHIMSDNLEEFNDIIKFLKENGGRFDPEKKAWYIAPGKLSRAEMNEHKIGEYLQIAYQEKSQFMETVGFLKENGARFDNQRQSWYLTPKSNHEEIKAYLNRQFAEKKSILSKLDENKGKIEKGGEQYQRNENEIQR